MCLGMNPDILDGGRALRLDLEPQLRGAAGQGWAHPPGQPEDGGGRRHRGTFRRHQGLELKMRPIDVIEGKVSVLDRADVDTDQIIPKQFLKRVERTGFGEFLFYDWIRDGEIELAPNPILVTGAQLRLRLFPRARSLGAGGLRLPGDRRAVLRRHLLLQLHEDRAAAGDPRRGSLQGRRRGRRGADRRRRRDGHLRRRRLRVRGRTRRQAPAAERPRRHRHHPGERGRDRRLRVRRRGPAGADHDRALRRSVGGDQHRTARVGRRDLRRDLRSAVRVGDGGARSASSCAGTRPWSTPAAGRDASPRSWRSDCPTAG